MTTAVAATVVLTATTITGSRVGATSGGDAAAATSASPGTGVPFVAAWGFGLTPNRYRSVTVWLVPHPDDEGSLWAAHLNTATDSFPVYVVLSNGENTAACTNDGPIQYAPAGNLGAQDLPPFNAAGDLPGAPAGYVGGGPPPEADGAQGDDPPVFPTDPPMDPTTGWAPLQNTATVSRPGSDGSYWTEGFDGPCRASRIAALTAMLSYFNSTAADLSAAAAGSAYPSVAPGEPPDGQQCFSAPMGEAYVSGTGRYSAPRGDGAWASAPTPAGISTGKDPCAYYWQTPTGDLFVFNLGDGSMGFRSACPSDLGGRLRTGAAWPAGTNGYDSVGSYPPGSAPGDGTCPGTLGAGQESYGVTPSDAVWAVQQAAASSRIPVGLPVAAVRAASWANGTNPAPGAPTALGGIGVGVNDVATSCAFAADGTVRCAPTAASTAPACQHYAPAGHYASGLAAQWNSPLTGVGGAVAVCAGDPLSSSTFGTDQKTDGIRFWARVYGDDSTTGWQAASRAYAWVEGVGGFDPYGAVVDTCPGAATVTSQEQSQFSCEESLTEHPPGTATPPGDGVDGMSAAYTDPAGHGLTRPL